MSSTPPNPVGDGRDTNGRFAPGNRAGKGNPFNKRTQAIRAALMRACDPVRIRKAAEALIKQAEDGDRFAFAEILDRTIGKAVSSDVIERLERLEAALLEKGKNP